MQNVTRIKPLHSKILIKKLVPPQKTGSGIIIPNSKTNTSNVGKILEIGEGQYNDNGTFVKTSLQKGQFVLLPDYGGVKLPKTQENEELFIYQEDDILGIVEGNFERL